MVFNANRKNNRLQENKYNYQAEQAIRIEKWWTQQKVDVKKNIHAKMSMLQ